MCIYKYEVRAAESGRVFGHLTDNFCISVIECSWVGLILASIIHTENIKGRNWNNGETIELVLRRADGSFHGTDMLLNTLCHEVW